MVKIVYAPLKNRASSPSLPQKRVRDEHGQTRVLKVIDAGSDDFEAAFGAAFTSSVARARRQNKRVTGRPDSAPAD